MTLEDFFTLTEMRDGLSSLARIEELISMIQNLNDCVTGNLGDAVRQWSTVVNVLAATSSKECLNQFLQLNGLSFIKQWLQDALKLTTDVSGTVVEELISSLLSFFESSPIDYKWITASGIGITIELLLDHKSAPINKKAKILYDKWNHAIHDDRNFHDQDLSGIDHGQPETSQSLKASDNCVPVINQVSDAPPSTEGIKEGKHEEDYAGTQCQVANVIRCLESPSCGSTRETVLLSNQVLSMSTNPLADVNSSASSIVSNPYQENLLVREESSACASVGQPSTRTCSKFCQEGRGDDRHDASASKDVPHSAKEMDVDRRENRDYESNQTETCSNSSSFAFYASMTSSVAAAEQTISCKLDSSNGVSISDTMNIKQKAGSSDHQKEKCLVTTKESNPTANIRSDSHSHASTTTMISNSVDLPVSAQWGEATDNVVKDLSIEVKYKTRKDRFVTSTDFLKIAGNKTKEENGQKSDSALECLDDALEVARQVAIAVEREVVDYREPFCSSPEVNSIETRGSHSPGSEGKQDEPETEEVGVNSSSDHSGTSSPEKGSEITQNLSFAPELSEQDTESAKPGTPSGSVGKSKVDRCTFDLNSDVCSDDPDCFLKPIVITPIGVSAPVAVIASSKGAPGLPVTLCFGGEMGWKGSAATSAFRPASPRRTPDGEKKNYGLKQKPNTLDFDLNVAEGSVELADEPMSWKKLPASFSLPSGDSCVEVSSRTEKINLDLNRLGDDDNTSTHPHSSWKLNSQNREPFCRNFDLNDNLFPDGGGVPYNFSILTTKVSESYGGSAPCDPVIKIMGSKIAVEMKDNATTSTTTQDLKLLPNGTKMEPAVLPRQVLPCTNLPTAPYGYTGFLSGPNLSVPPAYYPPPRNISYMVVSRGTTAFMPHISGMDGSGLLPSGRPPFLLGATGVPPNMAGFGSSQPGFDLNNGMTLVESGTRRDGNSFKQFHNSWVEEGTTKPSLQPSSSTTTLKRKEADSTWEPLQHGYKKMTSSWQ